MYVFQKLNGLAKRCGGFVRRHPLSIVFCYAAFYFPVFFYLEQRPVTRFHVIHCWLDDVMPFVPAFVIPYLLWFLLLPGALMYFLRREPERYYELCWLLFAGMTFCLLVYLVAPNCIYLRRPLSGDGVLINLIGLIRTVDTPTDVCPSIHVASTVAVMITLRRSRSLRAYPWVRRGVSLLGVLICLSTVLLDQHSVVDLLCGVVLTLVLNDLLLLLRGRHPLLRLRSRPSVPSLR